MILGKRGKGRIGTLGQFACWLDILLASDEMRNVF